jgi:prophage maintenance system killer protein
MENQIEIYKGKGNQTHVEVKFENETVWLSQAQITELFDRDRTVITKHINNIFKEGELEEKVACASFAHTTKHGAIKGKLQETNTKYYNLDVIISVGYRVKSKQGTQLRQWATQRLKDYLVKGYAINEQKLKASHEQFNSLKQSIQLLQNVVSKKELTSDEAVGLLKVVSEYAQALDLLDQYDHQRLAIPETKKEKLQKITYKEAIEQITLWRNKQKAGKLFGNEKDKSFSSSLETIYQTFDGKDLYPSTSEKAANLLYFIVKNHSFSDGNKRIAAGLFIYFLDKNKKLYNSDGNKIIADNALVAITIMIAESKTEEKDMMIKLIVNLMAAN